MSTGVDSLGSGAAQLAAERLHAAEVGRSCDFDYESVEAASEVEVLADRLLEGFEGEVLSAGVALRVAAVSVAEGRGRKGSVADNLIFIETIRSMLERVLSARNGHLEAACLLLAIGLRSSAKESMRSVARSYGVSANAVSKRVKELQEVFELPANSFNKSAEARSSYQLTNGRRKQR